MKKLAWTTSVAVISLLCVFFTLTTALALTPPPKKPLRFKMVAFLPTNNITVKGAKIFIDGVNKKFSSYLKIDLIGGPEVTPPFQLHEAVKSGMLDMALTSCGYFPSLLWEAQTEMYTDKDWKEISETPFFDTMSRLYKSVGLIFLGPATQNMGFYTYTNFPVHSINDFKHKKMRVFPPMIPLTTALGATPINLPMGDIYTAMERGTVDGFFMTNFGFVSDFSWNEVTKYALNLPIYQGTAVMIANPKSWDRLPKDVQEAIIAFKKDTIDPEISSLYNTKAKSDWDLMVSKGVKAVNLPTNQAKEFLNLAYKSAWDRIIAKSPKLGPELKAMLMK